MPATDTIAEFLIRVRVGTDGSVRTEVVDAWRPGELPSVLAGPACPEHLRELVRHPAGRNAQGNPFPASWRCAVPGCGVVRWDTDTPAPRRKAGRR